MIRTVSIFLDDFSSLSEEMNNVYLYDFGSDTVDYIFDDYQVDILNPSNIYNPYFPDSTQNYSTVYGYANSDYWGDYNVEYATTTLNWTDYYQGWDYYTDTYVSAASNQNSFHFAAGTKCETAGIQAGGSIGIVG